MQVTKALSQVNKERPDSEQEATSALSRALLSVRQGGSQLPAAKSDSDDQEDEESEEESAGSDTGLESDSLDEDSTDEEIEVDDA